MTQPYDDETVESKDPVTSPASSSGRHPVSIGHLVMGLAFIGLAAVWAVLQRDDVDLADHRWLLPLPWLVAGAVGLLLAVRPRRP